MDNFLKISSDSSFFKAAGFSLFFHLMLPLLLLFPSLFNKPDNQIDELKAFTRALIEMKKENPDNLKLFDFNDADSIEKSFMQLVDVEISGIHLNEKEKIKLYKDMFAAYIQIKESTLNNQIETAVSKDEILEVLRKNGASRLGGKLFPSFPYNSHDSTEHFRLLPESKTNKLAILKKQPEMKKNYVKRGNKVKINKQEGNSLVPADYFFRDCPYEAILAQGADLFSFHSGFWTFDLTGKTMDQKGVTQLSKRDKPEQQFRVFLLWKSDFLKINDEEKFLSLKNVDKPLFFYNKNESIDSILDELMQFPEPEQFERFRQKYLKKYNLDDQNLAELTREFFYRNLGSVFFPISDKAEAFDQIEELYFNKALNQRIYDFWKSDPDGRVGDEMMFYMATQIAFEKRVLRSLIRAYPSAKKFVHARYFKLEIYEEKAKCFVIKEIYKALMDAMAERKVESTEDLLRMYSQEQHKIYAELIAKGGEIMNRGLYAQGCLYWEDGRYDEAVQHWCKIDENFSSRAFQEIKKNITGENNPNKIRIMINDILDYYAHIGEAEYLARLEKYKKWSLREKILN